ncbi:MAG: HPr family phosphocarrier protein [Clostridia bacterium]|nr:HPr family phosphocarrier protein [Clostridia bacterium]
MQKRTVKVVNPQGFHMRPAGVFANALAKYECDITLRHNGRDVNAKSLMNLIAACIKCGSEIEIICEGKDDKGIAEEKAALEEACSMIESGLGEV